MRCRTSLLNITTLLPETATNLSSVTLYFCAIIIKTKMQWKNKNKKSAKWILDPSHSELNFKLAYMISNVKGEFKEFYSNYGDTEDFKNGLVKTNIETSSISTNNLETGINHLKSAKLFRC
ncbi:MAG: YceI family protein [Sphingobacterium sp.]|nr:YceI family protein [Sphingobacterium sp.]